MRLKEADENQTHLHLGQILTHTRAHASTKGPPAFRHTSWIAQRLGEISIRVESHDIRSPKVRVKRANASRVGHFPSLRNVETLIAWQAHIGGGFTHAQTNGCKEAEGLIDDG